ncbi:MAG TPA: hypothetical protein VFR55_14540 [Dehalococcoidia bacterium]|nr:hypothetical protein [Dehalococcoidia bacterium]
MATSGIPGSSAATRVPQIGSPQILMLSELMLSVLMLSGIGPREHLQSLGIPVVADLPGVGQNLRGHPAVWVTWKNIEGFPL